MISFAALQAINWVSSVEKAAPADPGKISAITSPFLVQITSCSVGPLLLLTGRGNDVFVHGWYYGPLLFLLPLPSPADAFPGRLKAQTA